MAIGEAKVLSSSAVKCPDCGEPTPTGGWVDQRGRTHHVGCGDPLGTKALAERIAALEAALRLIAAGAVDYHTGAVQPRADSMQIAHNALWPRN